MIIGAILRSHNTKWTIVSGHNSMNSCEVITFLYKAVSPFVLSFDVP